MKLLGCCWCRALGAANAYAISSSGSISECVCEMTSSTSSSAALGATADKNGGLWMQISRVCASRYAKWWEDAWGRFPFSIVKSKTSLNR